MFESFVLENPAVG